VGPPIFHEREGGETRLLEREDALALLHRAHADAAAGEGRIVLVTGEPGIGKTTLVAAFVAGLDAETTVLVGTCDDLSIARPLAPFADLVGSVSGPLEAAILGGARPQELHPLLHAELDVRSRPRVLVLEDVHWADGATLDAITFLARRIAPLHALLVLTLRPGETPLEHPLHAVLGDIPSSSAVFVELAPLSAEAVADLAGRDAAAAVFAATGGNPFLVTELLAAGGEPVPRSVAHAVLGRASRLDEDARRLVELVAAVPRRVSTSLLDRAFPRWAEVAAEPERRQLLEVRPRWVGFRHELARRAVLESIPVATRRRLHAEILAALLATDGDPAEIVHHAEAAGAEDVVAEHALVAARRAAVLHSTHEAYAHFHRAVDFLDRQPPSEQAAVLEELADAAFFAGRVADAIAAAQRASAIWQELGEAEPVGRCTRGLSRLHWFAGDGAVARAAGREATRILEPLGDSQELAYAYSSVAQLAMLEGEAGEARLWGRRALELADRLGSAPVRAHVLVTLGTVDIQADPEQTETLIEARRLAAAVGEHHEAVRALTNLGYSLLFWGLPGRARPYLEQALAEAEEREIHHLAGYARISLAWLDLRAGNWGEAERAAAAEARKGASVSELLAQTVLAELAVRRGDADADAQLRRLHHRAWRTGDVARVIPVLSLIAESSLLDRPRPLGELEELLRQPLHESRLTVTLGAAAAVAGVDVAVEGPSSSPFTHVAARAWPAAADAYGDAGWSYDRALMLTLTDDRDALAEALEIARTLGAAPLARRAARCLRQLGLRVPRGPYGAARENRARLTARQLEVLRLVVDGRTNAEIADQLVVSLRTAEHHVAAILAKLGASSRRDAARRAGELDLLAA
jgi:DNA-binding CsgD family transcriptional regulator/energy-coupling factor transporter ATP-binding protein EcfA2